MKNRLISIGWMGVKQCYLNVPREEAIRRYLADCPNEGPEVVAEGYIEEFEFDDEFGAYAVWDK